MNAESDARDMTKENIRPLKQGRKPVELETALQAQSNVEMQRKIIKEKETFEHAIRTYEGNDPLAPRYKYIKWLEQVYFKSGPESNALVEETVQKFKNDSMYKQDLRFVQILVKFIENQSNAIELYQTVYNQGLGTQCSLFYRSWADLLDRYNDFKRVDQIFMLGIQAKAEPIEDLEQAHLQFQLSIARRMINGQLSSETDVELDKKRQAFGVLKKSETHSGIRHGLGGSIGKLPQGIKNTDERVSTLQVFEDNNENNLFITDGNNYDLTPKELNKENVLKPGPWNKTKKSSSTVPKPVSTVDFEVHQDNNVEPVTKLNGVKIPHALHTKKRTLVCPVAVFGPPDPTKRVMYCKEKVYAAGGDMQFEELRAEMYFKNKKAKNEEVLVSGLNTQAEPFKKVILPEDNLNTNEFKVPFPMRMESDPLSQSVTVHTKAAIDLVQQMWRSPTGDKSEDLILKSNEQVKFDGFERNNVDDLQIQSDFLVYKDESPVKNLVKTNQKDMVKSTDDFFVYSDNNVENDKMSKLYFEKNNENIQITSCKIPEVYIDDDSNNLLGNYSSKISGSKCMSTTNDIKLQTKQFQVFQDQEEINKNTNIDNHQVYPYEDPVFPSKTNQSLLNKNQFDVENDDLTCTTKAFTTGIITSSTPVAPKLTKNIRTQLQSFKLVEDKESEETEDFQLGKNLSMILEASKERNSSTSSGIISVVSSITKQEQQSKIDFGDNINPFDDKLINKLLKNVIRFPKKHHMTGYIEHNTDVPNMRSEFKLGNHKMTFLGDLGKGSYARVVRARSDDKTDEEKALKIQKPACVWEWYIEKEIKHRLQNPDKILYFINMDFIHVFKNGSLISMDFSTHGTLLSIVQHYKKSTNHSIPPTVAALFALQVTTAIKYLHQCQIIHGDLKPDNVIVKSLPNESSEPCVQLIDFGRSIDMTLFPQDTTFTYSVKTTNFICHEMRDNLPWTYQTDYYGLAGIMYLLLMSDYMNTSKIRKVWALLKPLPRYIDSEVWGTTLAMLLNVESSQCLPNMDVIIEKLTNYLSSQQKFILLHHNTSFINVLKKK